MHDEKRAPRDVRPDEATPERTIGPGGGPPSDEERQGRGSTPTEHLIERVERGEDPAGDRRP